MSRISPEPYFQVNRPSESDFRPFQNLVSEHSSEGAPASLYNLTKSAPDPFWAIVLVPEPNTKKGFNATELFVILVGRICQIFRRKHEQLFQMAW